jgi:hypothetical protein
MSGLWGFKDFREEKQEKKKGQALQQELVQLFTNNVKITEDRKVTWGGCYQLKSNKQQLSCLH